MHDGDGVEGGKAALHGELEVGGREGCGTQRHAATDRDGVGAAAVLAQLLRDRGDACRHRRPPAGARPAQARPEQLVEQEVAGRPPGPVPTEDEPAVHAEHRGHSGDRARMVRLRRSGADEYVGSVVASVRGQQLQLPDLVPAQCRARQVVPFQPHRPVNCGRQVRRLMQGRRQERQAGPGGHQPRERGQLGAPRGDVGSQPVRRTACQVVVHVRDPSVGRPRRPHLDGDRPGEATGAGSRAGRDHGRTRGRRLLRGRAQ